MKRRFTEKESEEYILSAIRTVDYPWNLVLEGWYFAAKAEKRVGTKTNLETANQSKRRKSRQI